MDTISSADRHDAAVRRDLAMLGLPARNFPMPHAMPDVAIIGAGMCGVAAAVALRFQGVSNLVLLDAAPPGREGPWRSFARMRHLRSPKHLPGIVQRLPSLTFQAWYRSRFGAAAWDALYKIANADWADYVAWVAAMLDLPIRSTTEVVAIEPDGLHFRLRLAGGEMLPARRVVLATGRLGAGGLALPGFIDPALFPDRAAHASAAIDFAALAGRRIAVLGAGATGWDNAATALEHGAAEVIMLARRGHLPQVNKSRGSAHPAWFDGHAGLAPRDKWRLAVWLADLAGPPPHESVHRALAHPGFALRLGSAVASAKRSATGVTLALPDGVLEVDFLICATGFAVDLALRPELAALAPHIATWADRYPGAAARPDLAASPWLNDDFSAVPRTDAAPAALGHLYVFNHAATLSLGPIASDIPGLPAGAERLARGVAGSLFREDFPALLDELAAFAEPELQATPYFRPDIPGREQKPEE